MQESFFDLFVDIFQPKNETRPYTFSNFLRQNSVYECRFSGGLGGI